MKTLIYSFLILILSINCSNSENTQQEDKLELEALANEITSLADNSVCNQNNECEYIAFGSKPCGGPWSYLVYSTSIDTALLLEKVDYYNQLEKAYNLKWEIISDCSVANPPISLECLDGKCIANY